MTRCTAVWVDDKNGDLVRSHEAKKKLLLFSLWCFIIFVRSFSFVALRHRHKFHLLFARDVFLLALNLFNKPFEQQMQISFEGLALCFHFRHLIFLRPVCRVRSLQCDSKLWAETSWLPPGGWLSIQRASESFANEERICSQSWSFDCGEQNTFLWPIFNELWSPTPLQTWNDWRGFSVLAEQGFYTEMDCMSHSSR